MITILAEKPDVGKKIAAALDKITLSTGKTVSFDQLKASEKAVKAQQSKDGYLKIRYDGQDCYVTWGFGHLCELKQAKDYDPDFANWRKMPLPFIPDPYEIMLNQLPKEKDKFGFNAKIKNQFKTVKDLFNKSDYIVNATDFDREGEVIFSYIYELAKCKKPVKRACFASQTKEGICDAFKKLIDGKDMKAVETAGRMRGIADWVVGANLTAAMTLKYGKAGTVLSIGRVQTPTLKMLVDKELAIKNFVSAPYWTIDATFTTAGGETYTGTHSKKRFDKETDADSVMAKISGQNGTVKSITEKTFRKEPPLLFSLPTLQMEANSRFGMTLKETLDAAQALYDGGYTTYPRTNSSYLTEDMEPVVNGVLDVLAKNPSYSKLIAGKARKFNKPHYFNDKMVESHFAIIPTTSVPSSLPKQQEQVYDLICKSVICMLYGSAVLNRTTIVTDVSGEEFNTSGTSIKDAGYMAVTGADKEAIIPHLTKGEIVDGKYEKKSKMTEPPKRYTDKTILSAMIGAGKEIDDEELKKILSDSADPSKGGIGTPATRDAILETLIARGYARRAGKSIFATDKGVALIQTLPVKAVKSPEMTARWEQRLRLIEAGKESAAAFQADIEKITGEWCNEISAMTTTHSAHVAPSALKGGEDKKSPTMSCSCPICGKPMVKQNWGYGCSGYRDGCKFSIGTICGKKLTSAQVNKLLSTKDSGLIKGFVSKNSGKKFDAHLVLTDDNRVTFRFE